jgi:hypothetical protein
MSYIPKGKETFIKASNLSTIKALAQTIKIGILNRNINPITQTET